MIKKLTTAELRNVGGMLFSEWEGTKDEIKLPGKSLYNLLALKKVVESHLSTIEETLAALAKQFEGIPQENGSIFIPQERRAEANEAFRDFGFEEIEVEYNPIKMREEDSLPVGIYEALFDFITFIEE